MATFNLLPRVDNFPSARDAYAQTLLVKHIAHNKDRTARRWPGGMSSDSIELSLPAPSRKDAGRQKIGIIGAGASGLYAAMLLDSLGDIGFDYEILEADKKRIGGRLYTHHFDQKENEYFDIGAMRFPDIPFMKRTLELITLLGLDSKRIEYNLDKPENLNLFNGICYSEAELAGMTGNNDPFKTGVPGLTASASAMAKEKLGPFLDALKTNFVGNWPGILKSHDKYSTRTYMTLGQEEGSELEDKTVTYLETFNSATGLYNCALVESVMDSLDFSYAEHVDWFCLQGGADQISTRMAEKVRAEKATDPISLGAHVTKIAFVQSQVEVSVVGEASPRRYDHVISTVPFGCLRTIDTSECPFSWELQTAIRTLHYDTSVKVGIQFKTRWWEQDGPKLNHRGGLSNTDLPVRTIVYPSYGIGGDTGATMIGTYTWAQDAARFGGLINGKNSVGEGVLLEQILGDLARVHDLDVAFLREQVVDYKAFDWYAHPYANGAFALFTTGQFKNLYPNVTESVGGRLHFAGEATSVHHAWIVGSLNSAMRCVEEILASINRPDLIKKLEEQWGPVHEAPTQLVEEQVKQGILRMHM